MSSCTYYCPFGMLYYINKRTMPSNKNMCYFQNNITEVTSFPSSINVTRLDLSHNTLHSFPELSPIKSTLQVLVLNYNYLTTVPAAMLDGFVVLRELKIRYNYVSSIPDVPNIPLERLELVFNNLTSFPHLPQMGAKLKWLFATGNPIHLVPEEDLLLMPNLVLLQIG